jgi:hypothetical protein
MDKIIHNGIEYHVKFIVTGGSETNESPADHSKLVELIESDNTNHSSDHSSAGGWISGVADYNPDSLDTGFSEPENDSNSDRLVQPPLDENVRPGKKPKVTDSELSERELERRNRRRHINRECARKAREARNREKHIMEIKIRALNDENIQLKEKFNQLENKYKKLTTILNSSSKRIQIRENESLKSNHSNEISTQTILKPKPVPKLSDSSAQTVLSSTIGPSGLKRHFPSVAKHRSIMIDSQDSPIDQKRARMQRTYSQQSNKQNNNQCVNEASNNQAQAIQTSTDPVELNESITSLIKHLLEPMQNQIEMLTKKVNDLNNPNRVQSFDMLVPKQEPM